MDSNHGPQAVDVIGYADRLSVAPGESIAFMVSSRVPEYRVELVRLIHGDPNPAGPGFKCERVASGVDGAYRGRVQPITPGSYVLVEANPIVERLASFTVGAWVWPTTPDKGRQTIVALGLAGTPGFRLAIDDAGHLELELSGQTVRLQATLLERRWHFVWAGYDGQTGRCILGQRASVEWPGEQGSDAQETVLAHHLVIGYHAPLSIAGACTSGSPHRPAAAFYNGKIDNPWLFSRLIDAEEIHALASSCDPVARPDCIAAWDFAVMVDSDMAHDRSRNRLHGRLHNLPARAMTGHNWSGRVIDFKQAPGEYGAIHFHDDDVGDVGWDPSFQLAVPPDWKSGVYAARVKSATEEDLIPFFVRPPRGRTSAPIALLIPTLSYLAYSNWQAWNHPLMEADFRRVCGAAFDAIRVRSDNRYMVDNRLKSLYDVHTDGSGVCYVSRLHPHVNWRPGYRWPFGPGGCAHQLATDLYIVDWLESKGFACDVITDDDLDAEGEALLQPYRVVLTGSHPEYWTEAMLGGLEAYMRDGGRLMYLGGNSCYGVTSLSRDRQTVEIRREHGTRTWVAMPGESFHSTTGEPGGNWRHRGRPEHRLMGIGFTSYGVTGGAPYRRTPASRDPRVSFIFEGVAGDLIGDLPALMLGYGAAGLELDRYDPQLGSPLHALVVASATGMPDEYIADIDEFPACVPNLMGHSGPTVRADMTYVEYPKGGAIWGVGSITWTSCLSYNNYDNSVSRVTENVLRRFLNPGAGGTAAGRGKQQGAT